MNKLPACPHVFLLRSFDGSAKFRRIRPKILGSDESGFAHCVKYLFDSTDKKNKFKGWCLLSLAFTAFQNTNYVFQAQTLEKNQKHLTCPNQLPSIEELLWLTSDHGVNIRRKV